MEKPVTLCILDGWGIGKPTPHNAIYQANTPNWDALCAEYSCAELRTDGVAVGLPEGQMGNSEVGHMTIGSGRIMLQDLPRIDDAIKSGKLAENDKLKNLGKRCHIIGLFSDGGVHAHISHIKALAEIVEKNGAQVFVHALLDGRDVAQKSANKYLQNCGLNIATIGGRYYGMDRDKRWDRVEKAYDVFAGIGNREADVSAALEKNYSANVTDEFIIPTIIGDFDGMQDGDSIIFANFRADRARQLITAMVDPEFAGFARKKTIHFAKKIGMVEYSDDINELLETLFPAEIPKNSMPEIVSRAGLKQLRTAETEKYAHVTFFMSGGREQEFAGEERILVPSPNVATYDLQPEMSSVELADKLAASITSKKYELIIANFANTDMVGHSGNLEAAKKAVEAVDDALGKLRKANDEAGGVLLITADHGNAEEMSDEHDNPHTQHSLNPVPFLVASRKLGKVDVQNGGLADIAPTILKLLDLEIPTEMTGKNLIS